MRLAEVITKEERRIREMGPICNVEDAVQWCVEESADVEFLNNVGVKRVWVKIAGHPVVVRDNLVEAVNVLNDIIRKRKSDECLYIW